MEDQNGNKEEQAGQAPEEPTQNTLISLDEVTVVKDVRLPEEIGHDVRTSENQGHTEAEGSIKGKEGLELREEKYDGSTPTGDNVKNSAEDRMEENTDTKMKGKDISLDEAGEDKIEAFSDQEHGEEFVEGDVHEHCEEAETLRR
ncbi:hypothetical protein HAX54_010663 [Datura stramonium]|uniref:Uncharacterized protein n=1 Tax=Datura stramonium TaxID=4076 RepID=A0ABS8TGP4_DATST|nr:hypothetical protein [Datura stramonium]